MGIIVSKFGGSSIADAAMFKRVREIVSTRPENHYIVLSAPGKRSPDDKKITDLLCQAHSLYSRGADGSPPLREVKERFEDIIRALQLDISAAEFLKDLDSDVLHSADLAASRGEFLCAKLFALYADLPFCDASSLIHFDDNGLLQRSKTAQTLRTMAARLSCAVIPGFYGSLSGGEIKTFSRGGSDITGALVAAALNADVYQNWTDVAGLMSADPTICPEAFCHSTISYRQMLKLSQAGAQVLHPYCLEPVREAGIPTVLRNTFHPEEPGTYISDRVQTTVSCICVQDAFRVLKTDLLNEETQNILSGLEFDDYRTQTGDTLLVLHAPKASVGFSASLISLFGLSSSLHQKAMESVDCLGFRLESDCLKLLVPPEKRNVSVKTLHKLF